MLAPKDGVIGSHELEALFDPWTGRKHIIAAVSGGPDSIALLHMLSKWSNSGDRPKITAATVDHGLRPEAAAEAAAVQAFAAELGVDHNTLIWAHGGARTPATKIQERAREARYELLADHAKECGADVVMCAHHADDQAETILFRLTRGSGPSGLAGMLPERPLGDLFLARPLLALRKEQLVQYCHDNTLTYCSDPSNGNRRYARTRMRSVLPVLEAQGLGPDQWNRYARRMAQANDALEHIAAAKAAQLIGGDTSSGLIFDFAALSEEPDEIVLRVLLQTVRKFDPRKNVRLDRAETLLAKLLIAVRDHVPHHSTLGQAVLRLDSKGALTLKRQSERKRGRRGTP